MGAAVEVPAKGERVGGSDAANEAVGRAVGKAEGKAEGKDDGREEGREEGSELGLLVGEDEGSSEGGGLVLVGRRDGRCRVGREEGEDVGEGEGAMVGVGLREGRRCVEGVVGASEVGARVFLIGSSPRDGAADGDPEGPKEDGEEEGASLGSVVGVDGEEGFGEEGERVARVVEGGGVVEGEGEAALPEQIAALTSSMGQMAMLRTNPAEAGTPASPTCTSTAVTTARAKGSNAEKELVTTPRPARRERLSAGLGSRDVMERVSCWPHETTLMEDHERSGSGSRELTDAENVLGSDCEYDAITRKVLLMNWTEGTEL